MSRMLREEDVLRAIGPDCLCTGNRVCLKCEIEALPAADDPRAEAAERLALEGKGYEDAVRAATVFSPDEVQRVIREAGAKFRQALAAWREAGK